MRDKPRQKDHSDRVRPLARADARDAAPGQGMTRRLIAFLVVAALVAGACGTSEVSAPPTASPSPSAATDWHDAEPPTDARAEALLAEMTIDEKIGQMTQLEKGSVDPAGVADLLLGSVLSGGGGSPAAERRRRLVRDGRRLPGGRPRRRGSGSRSSTASTPSTATTTSSARRSSRTRSASGAAHDADARRADRPGDRGSRWPRPASAGTSGRSWRCPQDVRWGRTYEGYGEDPLARRRARRARSSAGSRATT